MTDLIWPVAIDMLLENEGGYVCNKNDKGGETKYGISKKAYPSIDICNLTEEQAKDIYFKDYWYRCKCNYMPDALSVAVFDFAVNSGTKRAITYLQMALGVKADGIIGNQTIGACNRIPVKQTLETYINLRKDYVSSLKDFKYFGKGWINRINKVQTICEGLV